ncbi:(d)CMP kinase [Candidatus Saccharibacteria bacterium]|nr:(d)CMP kinase [Candidatus Saccharibacteria bacterium]
MSQLIIAITGPGGAGKSTVAKILAKKIKKCVNIEVDSLKHFIVNGFVYDESPTGLEQWDLLGNNIGVVASNFRKAGYNIIINGYLGDPEWYKVQEYVKLTHKFLLLPQKGEINKRDAGRDDDAKLGEKMVSRHHKYFSGDKFFDDFIKIDSTNHTVEETTEKVLKALGKNWGEL